MTQQRRPASLASGSSDRQTTRPLILELAGPAGAGKTTLRKLLSRPGADVNAIESPGKFECLRELPKFVVHARPWSIARRFTRSELRSQLYLSAWLRSLNQLRVNTLFDQGPVYRLAVLDEFGPRITANSALSRWRQQLLRTWSEKLDLVVWLDAHNDELLRRIRGRSKEHRCESLADRDAHALLDRYREAHLAVIDEMCAHSGPRVLRLTTSSESPEHIANLVRQELSRVNCRSTLETVDSSAAVGNR